MKMYSLKQMALGAVLATAALTTSYGAAFAAPTTFTWDPSAAVSQGDGPFTANNSTVQDFARITVDPNGTFTEQAIVAFRGFDLNNTPVFVPGLGFNYTIYISFTGTGTQSAGNFNPAPGQTIGGNFTSGSFEMFAANSSGGVPTFSANAGGVSISNIGAPVLLATGTLISGTTALSNTPGSGLSASANVVTTFDEVLPGFFIAPDPSMVLNLFASVTNTGTVVTTPNPTTLVINGGGGNVTLAAAPVPEPASLALLGMGLVGLGLVRPARKRA